jgi:effector-binding domain-containing protein
LKTIKEYFNHRYPNVLLKLLIGQRKSIEDKLKKLAIILRRLNNLIGLLEETLYCENLGEIEVVEFGKVRIAHMKATVRNVNEMEFSIRSLVNKMDIDDSSHLLLGQIGFTVTLDDLRKKDFQKFSAVSILLDSDKHVASELYEEIEPGKYLRMKYRGLYRDSDSYFVKILDFVENNNYQITGDAIIRALIDDYISLDVSKCVTEIQIPVKDVSQ